VEQQKILAYAIAYLEYKIDFHEEFLNKFEGDKRTLAQYKLVEKYRQELQELKFLMLSSEEEN